MSALIYSPSEEQRRAMAEAYAVGVRFLGLAADGRIGSLQEAIAYMESEARENRLMSKARHWVADGSGRIDRAATLKREEARVRAARARKKPRAA